MTRGKWLGLLAVVAVLCLAMARNSRQSAGGDVPSLMLRMAPVQTRLDAGPTLVFGAESDPNGTPFVSADILIEGAGDCRVYFDRRDNANFHYLDRQGDTVALGLSEAGLEQVFAIAKAESALSLRIARHGAHIGVFQQGRLVASAFDDRLLGGSVGARMVSGGTPVTVKVAPRDDIHFADDFMIAESKGAQWHGNGSAERGDFTVRSLKNPLLSANAFNYMGAGSNIYSVAGQPWWDRYKYEASLRGPAAGVIGLIFAFQDEKNYGLFRWSARKTDARGAVTDAGKREWVRVSEGKEEVIVQSPGGYLPDQWYAALIRVTYGRASISIDGHTLLETADSRLTCGGVGVWCDVALPGAPALDPRAQAFQENSLHDLMRQHAVFDDVRVNTLEGFEDEFQQPGPLAGGWMAGAGDWTIQKTKDRAELQVRPSESSTKAVIGDRRWAQYEVEADVKPGSGSAGLVFLHRDESNYYTAVLEGGSLRLTEVADGKARVVDSAQLPAAAKTADGNVHLKAEARHGHVRATASNGLTVETFAGDTLLKGRAGIVAAAGRGGDALCAFSRFRLSFLGEREPLVTTNAIFEDELTMNDWTSPTSEWYPPKEQLLVDGRPVNLLWHRSQFPGDVELMVEPREFPDPKYEIALSVAKDGQGKNNGYVFRYRSGDTSEGASRSATLQLLRQGELKTEKILPEDKQLASLALRRCGKYIVAMVNGRPAISYRDDKPLVGNKVAYYTQGVLLRSEATKISSNNFFNDVFSRAPVSWRTAGMAIAEVANRWQCDPRWSFFSLKNDLRTGRAAVLWSKNLYPGDVTIEFFVGNKMEGERGQPYQYARDINVTICSDGADLNKGYTFMWGGENNSASMIKRNGETVASVRRTIPTDMNYHRHWFAFKIEKQAGKLTFRVDRFFSDGGKVNELEYTDPQPIAGGHVAIWTYNHAIMISRVRISGDGGNAADHPDWQPEPLKTPYDDR